jgi:hypothetical protein
VIIFPTVTTADARGREHTYALDKIIDKLETFGYTTLSKPVLYSRPNAIVKRQIYRFRFNKKK